MQRNYSDLHQIRMSVHEQDDHNESNIGIAEGEAEVGYWIGKPFWNQGYCTEALREMIDYCFNSKGFLTLWADHFVDNPASGKVMEKCGFRDTGDINWLSELYKGDERPVKIMRLAKLKLLQDD